MMCVLGSDGVIGEYDDDGDMGEYDGDSGAAVAICALLAMSVFVVTGCANGVAATKPS